MRRIRCRTLIGFRPHELDEDQDLYVSVRLHADLRAAAAADDVEKGIDYRSVTKRVRKLVESRQRRLIETVAEEVAALGLTFPGVVAVEVTVEKPGALSDAETVLVAIRRMREANVPPP